jgi:hypothetical protein
MSWLDPQVIYSPRLKTDQVARSRGHYLIPHRDAVLPSPKLPSRPLRCAIFLPAALPIETRRRAHAARR